MRFLRDRAPSRDEEPSDDEASEPSPPPARVEPSPPVVDVEPLDVRAEGEKPSVTPPRAFTEAPTPRQVVKLVPVRRRETPLTPQGTAPGSYDEGILHQWAEIRDAYNRGDWRYETDGDAEDRLIAMEERLCQSLYSQTKDGDAYWKFVREVQPMRRRLGSDEKYLVWLHMHIDQTFFRRSRSYSEADTVDWGYATKLAPIYEYFGEELANWLVTKASKEGEEVLAPTFEQLAGVMWNHNAKNGATLVAIDASRKYEGGVTGLGKSQLGIYSAASTHDPRLSFHIVNDIVFQADIERFKYLTEKDPRRFRSAMIDESQLFLDKRRSQAEDTRRAGLRYMTKRYLNQFDYLIGPSIFYYDERFVYGQIQFRFHIVKPGFVKVYQWNGEMDEEKDAWGRLITQFHVPEVDPRLFRAYEKAKSLVGEFGSYNEARKKSEAFNNLVGMVSTWLERSRAANERTKKAGVRGLISEMQRANLNIPRGPVRAPPPLEVDSKGAK